jgi:uncharacterized protein (TIGR02284 family)
LALRLVRGEHLSSGRKHMTETIDHEKVIATLKKLIDTLRDSQEGFLDIGKHIKDTSARLFFMQETQERAKFAAELENELHHLGVKDVEQSGMVSGKIHRAWGELKANLGGGDHTLLATAEQGEDAAKKAYKEALEEHLPLNIREVLTLQQSHIQASHDKVRGLRDAKVA